MKKTSSDIRQPITTRTSYYTALCLIGIIILLITLLAGFQGVVPWFFSIVGAALAITGGVYLLDCITLHEDKEVTSSKWKIYGNIISFVKAALFQIDMFIMGIAYIIIATLIYLALFY